MIICRSTLHSLQHNGRNHWGMAKASWLRLAELSLTFDWPISCSSDSSIHYLNMIYIYIYISDCWSSLRLICLALISRGIDWSSVNTVAQLLSLACQGVHVHMCVCVRVCINMLKLVYLFADLLWACQMLFLLPTSLDIHSDSTLLAFCRK